MTLSLVIVAGIVALLCAGGLVLAWAADKADRDLEQWRAGKRDEG